MSSSSSSALAAPWTPRPPKLTEAWQAMCSHRQAERFWLDVWQKEGADPDLVDEEVNGSIKALQDTVRLHRIGLK